MKIRWSLGATLPVVAVIAPHVAHATQYYSVEQAQQAMFPGLSFTRLNILLTQNQIHAIEAKSGISVRHPALNAWKAADGSIFLVDQVVGKHDFITYAVGLTPSGTIRQVEILEYREAYGYEVRNASWRDQFRGKTAASPLTLGQDIQNISGATLSSKHITEGIKRLLATYAIAIK